MAAVVMERELADSGRREEDGGASFEAGAGGIRDALTVALVTGAGSLLVTFAAGFVG